MAMFMKRKIFCNISPQKKNLIKPLITSNILTFDNISDEGSVWTALTKISGSFTNDSIAWIEIQWTKAVINSENKTFTVASVDTSKQANDIIIKVYDAWENVIAKYLYTLYYSSGKTENVADWFA